MKRALLASGAIATLGIAGLIGVGSVSAATNTPNGGMDTLVTKIAERFSLDKADVQKVFDEERAAREAEREQAAKDRLARAVTDGELTQEQADKVIAKQQEMRDFMSSLTDKTADERRTAMQTKRDELKQWAADNSIPQRYLHLGAGHHGGRGFGGPRESAPVGDTSER